MKGIDPATWTLVSPLLDEALESSLEGRRALLERVSAGHPRLAVLLQQLLADHEAALAARFLDAPPIELPTLAGTAIGAYVLERHLGSGGMGTVWLARRADGRFQGEVAVKLLHPSALTPQGAERFIREGTVLARLSHPHIARLLDAGVTPSGQPYLVLQPVHGLRLDAYADEQRLSIDARLALILQVLDAVAHAHAHLVVHRDLKPSNILVDSAGQATLLDFGIAKLIEDDAREELTAAGQRALTPEFAAPEQIRGEAITTATDIYALGVVLYRLLTGVHPTGDGGLSSFDLGRHIVEREPRPASATWRDADAAARAEQRASTPERLRRRLAGDLDTIVATALQKAPDRRYVTAAAFAGDLRCVLADAPIAARGDVWTYRARKFVRRHAAAVAGAAVLAATLAAATAITTNRMIEARRQRDAATFQARRAEASSDFMRYLVTQIGDTPMTMRQVLDGASAALERQYAGDPAFIARMQLALSGPYLELGENETAARLTAEALATATRLDDPELLRETHCAAAEDRAYAVDAAGARRELDLVRAANRRMAMPDEFPCLRAESELAQIEERLDDALRLAELAVDRLERDGIVNTTRYTSALNNLARVQNRANRLPEGLATIHRLNEVTRRIGREETGPLVVGKQNEAVYLRRLGRWRESEAMFTEARVLAGRAGEVPAYLLVNEARLLVSLARPAEAVTLIEEARARGGLTPLFVATGHLTEALAQAALGDATGARRALDALDGAEERKALPAYHASSIPMVEAMLAVSAGRVPEARAIVGRALQAAEPSSPPDPAQPELLEYAARLALEDGDATEAGRLAADAVRAADRLFGAEPANAFAGRARLTAAQALAAAGRADEARRQAAPAAEQLERAVGASHPWTAAARGLASGTPREPAASMREGPPAMPLGR